MEQPVWLCHSNTTAAPVLLTERTSQPLRAIDQSAVYNFALQEFAKALSTGRTRRDGVDKEATVEWEGE